MPLSTENPKFSFIQNTEKNKKELLLLEETQPQVRSVLELHYTCSEDETAFVYCSIINNYKQSSATSIWNNPSSVTVSGTALHFSSHHWFSLRTWASSSSVKSFLILKVLRISSGVFPLIILATVLHVTSSKPLMSK